MSAIALVLLLMGLAAAGPLDDEILTIDDSFFRESFVVYTGENEITKIVVPLNSINFDENTDIENFDAYTFFIEAGKGLFVLKNRQATKLLDNGNDISSSMDDSTTVFLGASDGIYTFNEKKKTAKKYGTLTDNIINIAVANGTEEIYILTADKVVYKVTDDGKNKEELTNVKDAQQIMLDVANNLYYVDGKKHVYVRSYEDGSVKKVKGLPAHPSYVEFLRPPPILDDCVPFIAGKKIYGVFSNGTAEFADLVLASKPSAYAVESVLYFYLAHDKKIYLYNLMDLVFTDEFMTEVKTYLDGYSTDLKEQAIKKALRH